MIEKDNIEKKELTQSQLAIYAGQLLNPGAPLYNMAHSFEIPIALDVNAFHGAFQKVIDQAEALRTIFTDWDNIPFQSVQPEFNYQSELIDFSSETDFEVIEDWMSERSRKVFSLSQCLFDSALIKLDEKKFIWFLNVHHLVTDATASTILYRSTLNNYFSIIEGTEVNSSLTPYYDYLEFEREQRNNEQSREANHYWEEKTKSLTTTPEFYGYRLTETTTRAERVYVDLGPERSRKLKEIAARKDIRSFTPHLTLFNIFSTLLFTYFYRISGQKKLAIGAPTQNRPLKSFKKTPGLFIEVFPLVSEINEGDSFSNLLNRVKIETNNYLRYAQPGLATRDINKSFNAILNYITAKFDDFEGIPAKSKWLHPDHCDPAHYLRCHVYDFDDSGEIKVYFDLNENVFNEKLRRLAPNHFLKLVDAFLSDIEQSIELPSIITEDEKNQFLERVPDNDETKTSVISQFEAQVDKSPGAIAVRFKNQDLSYSELNSKASQLSRYLKKKGLSRNDTVSIHLERDSNYIVSVLAVLKLGATFVPISSDQPQERIQYILKDSGSKAVITNDLQIRNIDAESTHIINLDKLIQNRENEPFEFKSENSTLDLLAYKIYTSGSTGKPKGVLISNESLTNYIHWAKDHYMLQEPYSFPLCTSIGFDLTITSTFLPLVSGGELIIYTESSKGPDISVMQVIEDNLVNSIKLTPSHLALLQDVDLSGSKLRLMIVGGEDFKSSLASFIQSSIGNDLSIFNEYGPTEATVGCIVGRYDENTHFQTSVPIGIPISNMSAYVLDSHKNLVPKGVIGELFLSGSGLAEGYSQNTTLTNERFLVNPFQAKTKMYRTGDLVRYNVKNELEYLGRVDDQVKLNGFRIELTDIESNLGKHPEVNDAAVVLIDSEKDHKDNEVVNCTECGLPSSYPNIDFDDNDVCHLCNSFKGYKEKTDKYFKTEQDLRKLLSSKKDTNRKYDCLSLLSGGKDSTYVLARLIDMGLKVLTFTLDNGYISDQAKANITRITERLGVDHIYGETTHMNKIFVDSLHRHKNVCNGCFKTIYTLSTKVALEKDIPFVVTGLSRGQFFETRLTEELFWDEDADGNTIDDTILEARKLYHQEEDAVKQHLDTTMFAVDSTFEKVRYVDFYRYSDVSLTEMLRFLKEKAGWVRPTDTGRSTNCLINQAGIHVHKKEKGYSNYSFPYSWDVRLGHKNRDEALEEINEHIDVDEVNRMLDEIGYKKSEKNNSDRKQLVGFYTSKSKIPSVELKMYLSKKLPDYMLPVSYKYLDALPLTKNGKVDKVVLKALSNVQLEVGTPFVAPGNEIEELLENVWKKVLKLEKIGVHDNFISLGGHSLAAIRVTARLNDELQTNFPLNKVFELPTISEYGVFIEEELTKLLQEQ